MATTVGKGKGKGKGKATTAAVTGSPSTPTDKVPNPASVPITACPPYLPHTLHHVPVDIRDRAAHVTLHSLALTLNLTDHDDFAVQSLARHAPELVESFLRFRTKQDRSQVSRALDAAVIAWFRRLAAAVAGTAPLGGPVAHLVHDVSVLALLDFCKWYGHTPSVARPVVDVLFTVHSEYLHDLDDVLRTITALVSRALQGEDDEDQAVVLARSVVDGLGALARLVAMYPHAAEIVDAALVLAVAALHDAVPAARPIHMHNVPVEFVVAVIRAKYLDGESPVVGPLVQMLEELLDSAQARAMAGATLLVVELAKDEGLVGDLDRVAKSEPSLFSVMARLKSFQPPPAAATPPAATTPPSYETAAVQDIELSLKVSQVQDLFPDIPATHITSLLARFSNSTEDLIDALLTDESLRVPPPPPAEAAKRTPAAPAAVSSPEDARLQASIRARLETMDELRTAQRVQSSKSANNMPEVDKAKILALAAAMAADEYDDEYDDTYDSVDAPVADGDESSEVSLRPVRNVMRGGEVGGVADPAHPHEEVLFRAFTTNPAVLERAGKKDPARAALRSKTGLTDQQIEGWAVMLKRDPRRVRQLEARYSAFHGNRAPAGPTDGAAAAAESSPRTQDPNGRDALPAHRGGHSSGTRGGGGRGGRGGGRGGAHSGTTDGTGAGRGGGRAGDGAGRGGARGGGRGAANAGEGAGRGGGRGRGGSSRNMRREGHFKKMAQNNALA
ncbi:hypothetical protein AMAG_04762 [Allomyces macrogynus ATCC 38327]|uniref:CUE domain-containing protein n=1 Tax=Allomyces macrogynus (strain ATCC 38327) TaxID=578462 RepID=A0A0L0S5Z1_ALLM3|nr:hypothetical protein AMAG_04762 [Allomyces macrogynus ATCC 38327]|eukprot:KNE57922.1 hypothetical protein AMAG_04762 [Allomyces macrogynus ATCC 38327]